MSFLSNAGCDLYRQLSTHGMKLRTASLLPKCCQCLSTDFWFLTLGFYALWPRVALPGWKPKQLFALQSSVPKGKRENQKDNKFFSSTQVKRK